MTKQYITVVVAALFMVFGVLLFSVIPTSHYPVDLTSTQLHNFYDREYQPGTQRAYRWAKPDGRITIPVKITGLTLIRYTATAAQHANVVTLESDQIPIARHEIQANQFRVYHILADIPWHITNTQTHLDIRTATPYQDANRTITVAVAQMHIDVLHRMHLPNTSVYPVVLIVLLTLISRMTWKLTTYQLLTLYGVHVGGLTLLWIWSGLASTQTHWYLFCLIAYAFTPWIVQRLRLPTQLTPHQTTAQSQHPHEYRADIDGIRALAVGAVVIYHFFPDTLPGGYIGVDVFFVISGYLISRIIIGQLQRNQWSFNTFYMRRIRRILPAVVAMLVVTIGLSWLFFPTADWQQLGLNVIAGIGFFANILLYTDVSYFNAEIAYEPLLHLWSLGVEEQFYIVLPLLLVFAYRKNLRISHFMVVGVLWSFIANIMLVGVDPDAAFYLPFTRFWELGVGGLLAISALSNTTQSTAVTTSRANLLAWGGLVAIIGSSVFFTKDILFPGYWALIPVCGAVALIAAGPHAWLNQRMLSTKIFVWIGLISFPLYLWHWPILRMGMLFFDTVTLPINLLLIGISVGLAICSYFFIEQPIRSGRGHPAVIGVASLLVAGIGFVMWQGWWESLNSNTRDDKAFRYAKAQLIDCNTLLPAPFSGNCISHQGSNPSASEYIIIGDSHAYSLALGLAQQNAPHTVTLYSRNGCLPFTGVEFYEQNSQTPFGCNDAQSFDVIWQALANQSSTHPRTIFVVGRYSMIQTRDLNPAERRRRYLQFAGPRIELSDEQRATVFADAMQQTLAYLRTLPNTKVVFVHQVPELDFSPTKCYYHPLRQFSSTATQCHTARATIEAFFAPYKQAIAPVLAKFPDIDVYDPMPLFCDDSTCYALDNNRFWYFDATHIAIAGSQRIANELYQRYP